jgi:LysR family carnitine catabolism transcriptional activator
VTGPPGSFVHDLLADEAARTGVEFTPFVELAPRGSTMYLAMAGAGVTVLPRPMAELARPDGAVVASLQPRRWRHVRLLHRAAPLSPAAQAMAAALSERPITRPL